MAKEEAPPIDNIYSLINVLVISQRSAQSSQCMLCKVLVFPEILKYPQILKYIILLFRSNELKPNKPNIVRPNQFQLTNSQCHSVRHV